MKLHQLHEDDDLEIFKKIKEWFQLNIEIQSGKGNVDWSYKNKQLNLTAKKKSIIVITENPPCKLGVVTRCELMFSHDFDDVRLLPESSDQPITIDCPKMPTIKGISRAMSGPIKQLITGHLHVEAAHDVAEVAMLNITDKATPLKATKKGSSDKFQWAFATGWSETLRWVKKYGMRTRVLELSTMIRKEEERLHRGFEDAKKVKYEGSEEE